MAPLKLVLSEILYRPLNFLLGLLAVAAAATLFVAGPVLIDAHARQTDATLAKLQDQTRKLMLTMGFNLMIVHKDVNLADFWADDFASRDLPQHYVTELADSPKLEHVRHLVATLQKKIEWRKRKVLLVGYLKETPQKHFADKKPMGYDIKPGEAFLGYELWHSADPPLKEGDQIDILGRSFKVARCQKEKGGKQDIEISLNLADAQQLLGTPDRVTQIMAVGCQCEGERLKTIRKELAAVLPDTQITEHETIATVRAEQRDQEEQARRQVQGTLEDLAAVVTPLVVLVCGVWVGMLAWLNVRERRVEIGLLRALGKSSRYIAGLFLGRSMLLGVLGGGSGYFLGRFVAQKIGAYVPDYRVEGQFLSPAYDVLLWTVLGAPLVCAVASYLPTLRAVLQDPAVVLRDA
jgi:putative ABC transport system permease protein